MPRLDKTTRPCDHQGCTVRVPGNHDGLYCPAHERWYKAWAKSLRKAAWPDKP